MRMRSGTSARLFKAVVLTLAGILAGTGPSVSAGTTVAVSGDSKPSECGSAKKASYSMELTGSLTGCWSTFIAHINCQEMNGFALYTEIGREEFAGKQDGQDVTFDTGYTFKGVFPSKSCPEPDAKKEIVGGCIHYISGNGLVGEMRFYDVMYGEGAPHYFYEGVLSKS
jgi:hypothetical protein